MVKGQDLVHARHVLKPTPVQANLDLRTTSKQAPVLQYYLNTISILSAHMGLTVHAFLVASSCAAL